MLLECSLACPPVWQPEGRRGLSMLLECSLACPPVAARARLGIEPSCRPVVGVVPLWQAEGKWDVSMQLTCSLADPLVAGRWQVGRCHSCLNVHRPAQVRMADATARNVGWQLKIE